jgi:hypothetical protein
MGGAFYFGIALAQAIFRDETCAVSWVCGMMPWVLFQASCFVMMLDIGARACVFPDFG